MDGQRQYPMLSACGLNCGLCPRFHTDGDSRCPGCGGEGFAAKRPSCGVLTCARRHGGLEYCYLCEEYPCKKYEGAALCDSFISHRNMRSDFERARQSGIQAYQAELEEKIAFLRALLADYNDGRRKSFYCTAVNLLELEDLRDVMRLIREQVDPGDPPKAKAAQAVRLFEQRAQERGISLRLNRKKG